MNCIHLIGRITKDLSLQTTQNGIEYLNFDIAVRRPMTKEEKTDFFTCVAWRQSAVFISNYFHKGSMIALDGTLETENYTDKSGNKRTSYKVSVSQTYFCGGKNESTNTRNEPPNTHVPAVSSSFDADYEEVSGDEELPF